MERQIIHAFIRRKGWRTTPRLAFPFALILNKTGNFAKKADMRFGGSGINKTC